MVKKITTNMARKANVERERFTASALIPSWQSIQTWLLRGACLSPGLLAFALALVAAPLRRPDGWLLPLGWTLAVGGIALTLLGATWRTRWQRCAGLLALALVGQACALAMIDAPNYSVLQHYLPWWDLLTSAKGFLLLGPLCQTVLVVAMVRQSRPTIETWIRRLLSMPQALILAVLIVFVAAYGTWDVLKYAGEIVLAAWILIINAVNLVFVAAAVPGDALEAAAAWIRRQFGSAASIDGTLPVWTRLFPWAVALWVTVISATLAWSVFERVPHIPDSVSYLFQARYFSTGRLYLPAPPDAASFVVGQVVNDGTKWFGYGFPGWPAVLALGVLVGVPWLVNPLLGGLTVLLAHAVLRRLYDRSLAHAVISLLAVSPWFLFMSASFMAHPVSVVWVLLALLAVEKARGSGRGLWGTVAGTCLGALFLVRPVEGILVGGVVGLWALGIGGTRLSTRALVGLVVACLLIGGSLFAYNYALTGDATYAPQMKWTDDTWYSGADKLGFGPNIGNVGWPHLDPLPGHGPLDVVVNAQQNFYNSNFELFGWSFGSLGFAALLLLWRRWKRVDWLLLGIILAIVAGHSLYWFSGGPDFGARYWYQTLIPLVVLTARGIQELRRRWVESGGTSLSALRIGAFVVTASVVALVNFIPWRSLGKYHHYRGMRADMARLAQACEFGQALVFVQEKDKSDYPSAFIFNPATLDLPGTIYARDVGPAGRAAVAQHFPDRPIWIVAGSPVLGGDFTLVAGPLPPMSVSAVDWVAEGCP